MLWRSRCLPVKAALRVRWSKHDRLHLFRVASVCRLIGLTTEVAMRTILRALALLLPTILLAPQANADIIVLPSVTLDGAQAGTGSPGTGSAVLTLDDVDDTLMVDLSYSGLTTPVTNAHIHCCAPPGVSALVAIPFDPPFVTGGTSGT